MNSVKDEKKIFVNVIPDAEESKVFICEIFPALYLLINEINDSVASNRQSYDEYKTFSPLLINYCVDGRCEVKVEENKYIIMDPGIMCIDNNKEIRKPFVCPTKKYTGVEVIINLDRFACENADILELLNISIAGLERFSIKQKSSIFRVGEPITSICEQLYRKRESTKATLRILVLQFLNELNKLEYVKQQQQDKVFLTRGQSEIAKAVERTMTENLKVKFSISSLAEEYGVSATSLKKWFGDLYGAPISAYMGSYRMKRAAEQLSNSSKRVIDIALSVGYENQSKFAAAFRRYWGYSPLEYKRFIQAKTIKGNERNY